MAVSTFPILMMGSSKYLEREMLGNSALRAFNRVDLILNDPHKCEKGSVRVSLLRILFIYAPYLKF